MSRQRWATPPVRGPASSDSGMGRGGRSFWAEAACYSPDVIIPRSRREERWNSISHALAFLVALVAFPPLVWMASDRTDALGVLGVSIFGLSMLFMLGASTAYHASTEPENRRILQIIDHMSIYIVIAGSYTPICMTTLRGPWGWGLLTAVWSIALLGVLLKTKFTGRYDALSTALYLVMGWLCLVAVVPIFERLEGQALLLLVFAGLTFSTGVFFYLKDHRRGYHLVWHFFVIGGCVGLYTAVLFELSSL